MARAPRTLLRPVLLIVAIGSAFAPAAPARAELIRALRAGLPAHATVVGRIAPDARLRVTVTLQPRDPASLAAYARAVASPFSPSFHRYLTPWQFARRFGATPAQIATVRRSLSAHGLRPGRVSAGGLSIPLRATAAQLERGLSVSLLKLALPGRRSAIAAGGPPSLDAGAARFVQSIVGLSSTSSPHPLFVRSPARSSRLAPVMSATWARSGLSARAASFPHVVTGGPQPCAQAQGVASGQNAHTADQIASAYGFSGLYGAGDEGSGVTVAIYELEPNAPSDIAAYQACYGIHASVSYVRVDGGVGSGSGSGEAALDIENLIGLAPGADVLVYQGPNSNSGAPGSGPYDTFSAIFNQDRARVVSVSWGQCESALGPSNAAAENTLFEQAAVQGQSVVAASGDSGSEDCDIGGALPQTQLAVDDPASQPYVTGVGGTTLSSAGPRPTESVWNNGGNLAADLLQPGAGGGGISSFWPMPSAQLSASPSLNVLGAGPSGAQCGHPGGYCREVPDVSADADPGTGYLIYWNGAGGVPGAPSGWQSIGGTSAAAPVWAALLTMADASGGCAGSPLGFAGPALYRAAGDAYASDFNDVASGNNDFTATNGGHYTAGTGYDEASGLGTPNGAALAAGLCADALLLTGPSGQRSTVGASVSLRLHAADARGAAVSFATTGLPPGLALDPAGGRISGRPRRTGTFEVSITAQDAQGSTASRSFSWSIGAAPRVSAAAVSGLESGQPLLTFTVAAGSGAPALRRLRVTLPADLRLASADGVRITTRGARRPRFTSRLTPGGLEITLSRPLPELGVALTYPQLRVAAGPSANARRSGARSPGLNLQLLDASDGTTDLHARLARSA